MNSPYMGNFRVTQVRSTNHDGLDLVGIDYKEIHSTVNGEVVFVGWENASDEKQGFGLYVCIKSISDGNYYYYGHLSRVYVTIGQCVKITDVIGVEGSTGKSTGSHCHYCVRPKFERGNSLDVSAISGIPNKLGVYNDGYKPISNSVHTEKHTIELLIDDKSVFKQEV